MDTNITARIQDYWTARTRDFSTVRKNELHSDMSRRWTDEIDAHLPKGGTLDVLDVGTGTGYFAILLAQMGHRVCGVDITPSMLAEAEQTAKQFGVQARFAQMDAQQTAFADGSFDTVVCRNLVWTLPDPERAYREWHRLLRPGGILLIFDANYADNVRNRNQKRSWIESDGAYGHIGITPALMEENAEITLAVPASVHHRPQWDGELAEKAGFSAWGADESAGKRILRENDLSDAPLFLFWAKR